MGGRAIWRAVTRVKPEQASKVKMWMPTRLKNGEGRVSGEAIDTSTCSIHRGSGHGMWKGDPGNRGRPVAGEGRVPDVAKGGGPAGVGEGHSTEEAG